MATARVLLTHGEGGDPEPRELERLNAMVDYCKTNDCLRGRILDYFGQPHSERCGGCGNCQGMFSQADVTVQAQMILSCIKRVRDRLGYYVGPRGSGSPPSPWVRSTRAVATSPAP